MILNGKAKKEFIKANGKKEAWIKIMLPIYQQALIIEWFDSVGIIINILLDETNENKFKYLVTDIKIRHLHCWTNGVNKESRQEATEKAIKKANDIYNARTN